MKTITIEIPEGKEAKWVNGVLTLVDEQPKDITERIKTFEDACKWCVANGKRDLTEQYQDALNVGLQRSPDILAYLKLRIITCALNEGWEPTFEADKEFDILESRHFPMFHYVQKIPCHDVFRINISYPRTLVFKSNNLAEYAAKQFRDIYMDFCHKGKE